MSRTTFRISRRAVLAAAVMTTTVGGGSLAGASPSAAAAKNATGIPPGIVLNYGDQQQSTETMLESSGVLNGAPYKVNFVEFASGPLVDAGFAANKIDLGGMGDVPASLAINNGLPVKTIAVSLPTKPSEFLVAKPGITSIKQLKGQTVAYTTGTAEQAEALRALASAGLTQADITQVNVSLEELGTAIESGSAVASVLSVEQLDDYRATDPTAKILASNTSLKPPSYSYILASNSALANPGEHAAIEDFVRRLLKANDWKNTHQAQWIQDYYVDVENQTIEQAKQILKNGGISLYQPITPSVNSALQDVVKLMYSAKAIPGQFATAALFNTSWSKIYNEILAKVPQRA